MIYSLKYDCTVVFVFTHSSKTPSAFIMLITLKKRSVIQDSE